MELSHEDIMDNTKSCIHYRQTGINRRFEPGHFVEGHFVEGAFVTDAVDYCALKFKCNNYDEAKCSYGLNDQPPMRQCPNRVPFPREKEGNLAKV